MNKNMKNNIVKFTAVSLVGMAMFVMAACGEKRSEGQNMIVLEEGEERTVNLFSPMEKTEPGVDNVARSASDKTVIMAEEKLGLKVEYITYTADRKSVV